MRVLLLTAIGAVLVVPMRIAHASQTPLSAHVTITVSGLKAPKIIAEYQLSRPVSRLRFSREANGLRTDIWHMITSGLKVRKDEIVSTSEKPFDQFRVAISPKTRLMNLNYVAVNNFADRGVSVFTGYFNIAGSPKNTTFSFRSTHHKVLLHGMVISPAKDFSPSRDGTFVYFGNLDPQTTTSSVILLDPSLPAWMRTELAAEVPKVINFYTERYGAKLPARPFLLFSWYQEANSQDYAYQGDALKGTISFVFTGAGWKPPTVRNKGHLAKLIAHELAHQWNAGLFFPARFESNGGSWLSEGQAEFAATATVVHFGWLSAESALRHYTDLVNQCLQAPSGKPIRDQDHNDQAIYGCGVTFNLLAQAALKRHRPPHGFFDLWRAIYAVAARNGGTYSTQTYVDNLARLSGNKPLAKMISELITQSATGKNRDITQALVQLGFGVKPVTAANDDSELGKAAAAPLFEAIMREDCDGAVSFYTRASDFAVAPLKRCHTLNKPYVVTAIDGRHLFAEGIAAYGAVRSQCGAGRPIQLTVKGRTKPVTVSCPAHIPAMPDMVELTSLPWAKAPAGGSKVSKNLGGP